MWIAHVDLDAFFASVEQRDDPALRGRPVVVGGHPNSRGVVCAASYEARVFGVRSAMSCAEAFRRCPQAVFVPPDMARYAASSRAVMAHFAEFADQVEPLSLDEAFLHVGRLANDDVTGITAALADLRRDIFAATGLVATAGAAPIKFLAKVASDAAKPNGLRVIPADQVAAVAGAVAISALPGVGRVTAGRLRDRGVRHARDLLTLEPSRLRDVLGSHADTLIAYAQGIDPRGVQQDSERLSIGIEDTFDRDVDEPAQLLQRLDRLAAGLVERLHRHHRRGRSLTLKITWSDFRRATRSHRLAEPIATVEPIAAAAARLLDNVLPASCPIRLLGLSMSHLEDESAPAAQQQTLDWAA